MTTATLRRVQIVDTHFDAMWNLVGAASKRMPRTLRRRIDAAQPRAWCLRFQRTAETFLADANARKHLLFVGGRWLTTRLLFAVLFSA